MAFVLINHGWTNERPEGHWQRITALALRKQGHHVFYPQYPDTAQPSYDAWLWLLQRELEMLLELRESVAADTGETAGEVVVIGHSLGTVLWLKAAFEGQLPNSFVADRLLLVAPPERANVSQLPEFDIVADDPSVRQALHASARSITLLSSDNDPWIPSGIQAAVGDPLGLEAIIIPGAAHLSHNDGWGKWQGIVDWVNDPSADLTRR